MSARLLAAATAVLVTIGLLVPASASAFWSVAATAGSAGAAAAAVVNQGPTPTVSVATQNDITVSWAPTTLSNGVAVTGYSITRFSATSVAQTMLSNCNAVVTTTTCTETDVPDGVWTYAITPRFQNWVGAISARSVAVRSDATAPNNAITRIGTSGNSFLSGTNLFYRGLGNGQIELSNAVADAGSGPASSTTSALGGTSTGWSHTPSTVSAPVNGPYVSNPFVWAAGAETQPTVVVTSRDLYGNARPVTISFVLDDTGPTGGLSPTPTK